MVLSVIGKELSCIHGLINQCWFNACDKMRRQTLGEVWLTFRMCVGWTGLDHFTIHKYFNKQIPGYTFLVIRIHNNMMLISPLGWIWLGQDVRLISGWLMCGSYMIAGLTEACSGWWYVSTYFLFLVRFGIRTSLQIVLRCKCRMKDCILSYILITVNISISWCILALYTFL